MSSDETEFTFVRCPGCRSLVPAVATRCRMCGQLLEHSSKEESPLDAMAKKSRVRQRTISVQEEGVDEIKNRLSRGEAPLQEAPAEEPQEQPRPPVPAEPEPPEEDFHFRNHAQHSHDQSERPAQFADAEEDHAAEDQGSLDFSNRPYADEPEPAEPAGEEDEGEEEFEDESDEAAPADVQHGGAPMFDGTAAPEGKKKRRRRRRRKKKGPAQDAAAAAPVPPQTAGFRIGRNSDEDKVFQLPPKDSSTPPPWRSAHAPDQQREQTRAPMPPPRFEEMRQQRPEPEAHRDLPEPAEERPPFAAEWLRDEEAVPAPKAEAPVEPLHHKVAGIKTVPAEPELPIELKAPEPKHEPVTPPPAVEEKQPEVHKAEPAYQAPKPEPKREAHVEKPRGSVQQQAGKGALVGWFVTYAGAEKGAATEIRGGRCFISREKVRPSDLVINQGSLSSPHCLLIADPQDGISIEDLLSENGTFVVRSGSSEVIRIEEGESTTLHHGDRIRLGEHEMLVCLVPR